jgi:hypothetical protein
VTLLISNQCFEINPVDIVVSIDGQVIVQEKCDVQGDGLAQHNWQRHPLYLEAGEHLLEAESKLGRARLEANFLVVDTLTLSLAFWCKRQQRRRSEGFFTLDHGRQPPALM